MPLAHQHHHIARLRQIDCRVKHQIVALRQTYRKRRAQQLPTPDGRKRAVDRRAASHHVDKIRGRHAPEPLYKLPRRSRKIPDNFTANRHLSSPPFLFFANIFVFLL